MYYIVKSRLQSQLEQSRFIRPPIRCLRTSGKNLSIQYEIQYLAYLQIWDFFLPSLMLCQIPDPSDHDEIGPAKQMWKDFFSQSSKSARHIFYQISFSRVVPSRQFSVRKIVIYLRHHSLDILKFRPPKGPRNLSFCGPSESIFLGCNHSVQFILEERISKATKRFQSYGEERDDAPSSLAHATSHFSLPHCVQASSGG